MEFYLPDIELKALQCRDGETMNWLNNLNSAVAWAISHQDDVANNNCCNQVDQLQAGVDGLNLSLNNFSTRVDTVVNNQTTAGTNLTSIQTAVNNLTTTVASQTTSLDTIDTSLTSLQAIVNAIPKIQQGSATITTASGVGTINVIFASAFATAPVVVVTPVGQNADTLPIDTSMRVQNITTSGFTAYVESSYATVNFNWIAIK